MQLPFVRHWNEWCSIWDPTRYGKERCYSIFGNVTAIRDVFAMCRTMELLYRYENLVAILARAFGSFSLSLSSPPLSLSLSRCLSFVTLTCCVFYLLWYLIWYFFVYRLRKGFLFFRKHVGHLRERHGGRRMRQAGNFPQLRRCENCYEHWCDTAADPIPKFSLSAVFPSAEVVDRSAASTTQVRINSLSH